MEHVYVVDLGPPLVIWAEISVPGSILDGIARGEHGWDGWDALPNDFPGSETVLQLSELLQGLPGRRALERWQAKDDSARDTLHDHRYAEMDRTDVRESASQFGCEEARAIIKRGLDAAECREFANSHCCDDHNEERLRFAAEMEHAVASGITRWLVVGGEPRRIFAETSTPGLITRDHLKAIGLGDTTTVSRVDVDLDPVMSWDQREDRFYLVMCSERSRWGATVTHQDHGHFVDLVADDEQIASLFLPRRGGGTVRTRRAMLDDLVCGGSGEHLHLWEEGNDDAAVAFNEAEGPRGYGYQLPRVSPMAKAAARWRIGARE